MESLQVHHRQCALGGINEEEMQVLAVAGPLGTEEFGHLAWPEQYILLQCLKLVETITSDIEKYQLGAAESLSILGVLPL